MNEDEEVDAELDFRNTQRIRLNSETHNTHTVKRETVLTAATAADQPSFYRHFLQCKLSCLIEARCGGKMRGV